MGISVRGNFTSPDGFNYSSFYLKITSLNININPTNVLIRVTIANYLSRELSKNGATNLNIKSIHPSYAFCLPLNKLDLIPILSYMYFLVSKSILIPQSSIEHLPVLEESQTLYIPSEDLASILLTSTPPTNQTIKTPFNN